MHDYKRKNNSLKSICKTTTEYCPDKEYLPVIPSLLIYFFHLQYDNIIHLGLLLLKLQGTWGTISMTSNFHIFYQMCIVITSTSVNSSHSKSVLNVLNPALCFLLDPAGKNCRKYKLYTNHPFHKIFAIGTTRERTRKRKQSCITFGFVWTYN